MQEVNAAAERAVADGATRLVESILQRLSELGLHASTDSRNQRGSEAGAPPVITLRTDQQTHTVVGEVRKTLRRATLAHLPEPDGILILSDYVTDGIAQTLRTLGYNFADSAGNAHIHLPGLFVDVRTGKRPEKPRHHGSAALGPALTPAGVPVVFTLLVDPAAASMPIRTIAARVPASLGKSNRS